MQKKTLTRNEALQTWLFFMNTNGEQEIKSLAEKRPPEEFKTIQDIGKRFIKRLNEIDSKKQTA